MSEGLSQEEKTRLGAQDAGPYFRYMTDFVGFTPQDAEAIQQTGLVIEKYIPSIVADFYAHLLRYPPTRKHFIRPDGTVDQIYLQKRMHHLTNFWRRTAAGDYDDEYARYIDYVGRAHTSHGADPAIYIEQRYVIGQVGFMQRAISEALTTELREYAPDLEKQAVHAWNMLMMVILEMLARVYQDETESYPTGGLRKVNEDVIEQLAVQTYELGLGLGKPRIFRDIRVANVDEIPNGSRKIVQVEDLSIGIFHHREQWYALRNNCLHAGGPVCTGVLDGDTLTCPWHGFQYNVTDGRLLVDPGAHLETYALRLHEGNIILSVPETFLEPVGEIFADLPQENKPSVPRSLSDNELLAAELAPGQIRLVHVDGQPVAVYNVDGKFYATADSCTHANGPLSQGDLESATIICPWHGSCFDVTTGAVTCGPATRPVQTYPVVVDGEIIRVLPG